jgi:hypothetical protein
MGFVCLVPDMIGKIDSRQITHDYGRDEKELWQSNGLGVQLWNNIRALDVLCAMPEVAGERIGMTGCSGGATQTLTLSLVDERIKAAAPINMISLEMQGGCQCENAPGLRRHTDNGEMCSMLAPRPLFLAGSTGDWTHCQETLEYPSIRSVYALYGAKDKAEHYYQIADHQYNARTRRLVYSFFARTLLGTDPHWEEQPIDVEDLQTLIWFRGKSRAPGFSSDEAFFSAHRDELTRRVSTLNQADRRKMLAWITGVRPRELMTADPTRVQLEGVLLEHDVAMTDGGVQLPLIRLIPADWDGQRVCLALGEDKGCVDKPAVRQMLQQGVAVLSGDLFLLGEMSRRKITPSPDPQGVRYHTTFHYTTDAYRIQDVALLWQAARRMAPTCTLWAEGAAARAAACALPLLPQVQHAWLDEDALDLQGDAAYFKHFFVPGIMLVGGIEGCLQLSDCPITRF